MEANAARVFAWWWHGVAGQNFLADPNLLEAIVREAGSEPDDVVLEVGRRRGSADGAARGGGRERVHVIELDERLRAGLEEIAARASRR